MRIKLVLITTASLIILLMLSACGGSNEGAGDIEQQSDSSAVEGTSSDAPSLPESNPGLGENFRGAMPLSAQLGFGTLLLEDSEYAVNPDQAAELLPLWKAARSLSESETVAQAELDAIFNQIEETMTAEQTNAIAEMQFSSEEMAQLMEDLGISFGFGGRGFENLTPEMQATAEAARESGEFPAGGFPGGGSLEVDFPAEVILKDKGQEVSGILVVEN
jgi:peptidoglycan hydrolase CwlO-like protein